MALGARAWPRVPRPLAALVGWVGLGMVLASLLVIDADTLFPGTWALLPTVGTALVLVAGPAAGSWGPVAVLRHALLQWVGRLSYSLYLWHWPFVAVAADRQALSTSVAWMFPGMAVPPRSAPPSKVWWRTASTRTPAGWTRTRLLRWRIGKCAMVACRLPLFLELSLRAASGI